MRNIEIDEAKNGFTTRVRYNTDGESYDPGDTFVHKSHEDVGKFVSGLFKRSPDDAKASRVKAAKTLLA